MCTGKGDDAMAQRRMFSRKITESDQFLDTRLEENGKIDFSDCGDYENGLLDGENGMIKELIMKMQKEVIGWHY